VAGEAVHDDGVAGAQLRDEHLGQIGLEGIAVDRPVEDPRRDEAAQGQRADEGRRLPMPVRYADPQPLATRAPTALPAPVNGGRDPSYRGLAKPGDTTGPYVRECK
jgi:hypothetical protein